jgi:hypothetical protein
MINEQELQDKIDEIANEQNPAVAGSSLLTSSVPAAASGAVTGALVAPTGIIASVTADDPANAFAAGVLAPIRLPLGTLTGSGVNGSLAVSAGLADGKNKTAPTTKKDAVNNLRAKLLQKPSKVKGLSLGM